MKEQQNIRRIKDVRDDGSARERETMRERWTSGRGFKQYGDGGRGDGIRSDIQIAGHPRSSATSNPE